MAAWAAALLAACAPAPLWVVVAGDGALQLYTPDLSSADTIELVDVLPPGERLVHVVAGADGSSLHLVTASDTGGAVVTLRRRDGTIHARAELAAVPVVAEMHPDGHSLMIAAVAKPQERSTVLFLPLDGARAPAEADLCAAPPRAMVASRALDRLYVACENGDIAEVDLLLRARIRTAQLRGACGPVGAGLSANATLVYVLCREGGRLLYLDRARLTEFDSAAVGEGASGLAMTPDRRRALITRSGADEVTVLNLRQRSVAARIAVSAPVASTVSSDGRWAYVVGRAGVLRVELSRPGTPSPPRPAVGATALAVWPGHASPMLRW